MITETIENRIEALSPKARKLFLVKLRAAIAFASAQNDNNQRKRIVAYVQGHENFSVDQLKSDLKKKLPDYMVPSQFISLETIPVLPNGKINRKQLAKTVIPVVQPKRILTKNAESTIEKQLLTIWEETLGFSPIRNDDNFFEIGGDSILSIQIVAKARRKGIILTANDLFDHQTVSALANVVQVEQKEDTNAVEEKLIKIWEETLGFSPIHRDDNFFEIGGDSILSIQIIAKARKVGIILKANDLFDHQTVGELSLFAKTESKEITNEVLEGVVPLSPIKHWFFNDHKNAPHYWNQGVRLDNLQVCSENKVQQVCDYIIRQHDALRLRFRYIESKWIKDLLAPNTIDALEYIDLTQVAPAKYDTIAQEQAQRVQDNFKLADGNLFKCIYFSTELPNNDFCVLISHHLLVDAVSWQIITDDFKTALEQITANTPIVVEAKTSSIREWNEHIREYTENISSEEFEFWKSQITPTPALPFDQENSAVIEEKDVVNISFSLGKETTSLLQSANQAYSTKTEELLITAFVDTIGNWSTHDEVAIGFERHGRETVGSKLDVSKTVGWFTSYFPVKFKHHAHEDTGKSIVAVKEKLRSVPNGGIGYGGLRYIKKAFGDIGNPEIVFNFLGTKTTSTASNTIKETTLTENLRDARSERHYKLEINLQIIDGELQGTFSYGSNVHHKKTIEALVDNFKNRIHTINDYCNKAENGGYTPSDFTDADISQDDLDNLMDLLT